MLFTQNIQAQWVNESGTMISESGEVITVDDTPPLDSPYEKHLFKDRRLLPYDHIREADVMWEKRIWRVIDVREAMNKPFSYPENPLASILVDAALSGDVKAYSGIDDKFSTRLTEDQLNDMLNERDTIITFDPDTYEEKIKVVYNDFDPNSIKRYRIKEAWFFDEETSTMQVRILGIAPLKEEVDDFGNFRFEYPLFWVYYPHCRELLAHEQYFNETNAASVMSWEDTFEMRYFASAIVKESNVHDRRIQDYKEGKDMLFEAERIKEGIRNYEHDLWTF